MAEETIAREEERPEAEPEKRGLVWNDLSEDQIQQFCDCADPADRIKCVLIFYTAPIRAPVQPHKLPLSRSLFVQDSLLFPLHQAL